MPLDTRFNEVEGGKNLYPDEEGTWTLVEEGEMKVGKTRGDGGIEKARWERRTGTKTHLILCIPRARFF